MRYDFIDNLKAVGIVMVLVGHAAGINSQLVCLIYGFHMPLFFFVSGFLLSRSKLQENPGIFAGHLWVSLLRPYLFFFAVSLPNWWLALRYGNAAQLYAGTPWWDPFVGVLVGTGERLYVNVVLWFFPTLAMCSFFYFLIRRRVSEVAAFAASILAALLLAVVYRPVWPRLPWGIEAAVMLLPCLAAGQCWRKVVDCDWFRKPEGLRGLLVLAFGFAAYYLLVGINGRADINLMRLGNVPLLWLPIALLGVALTTLVCMQFPAGRLARWLSENTIVIFPTHMLMFRVFSELLSHLGVSKEMRVSSAAVGVAYCVLALLGSVPVAMLIKRFFPWVLARRVPRAEVLVTGLAGVSSSTGLVQTTGKSPNGG